MSGSLFAELKRRNVFKAGIAYLVLGWVVTQVTATVAPALHLPDWILSVVVWIGVIAFPFVIAFSWIYEITPDGLKRESGVDRSASITHVTGRRIASTGCCRPELLELAAEELADTVLSAGDLALEREAMLVAPGWSGR
jgi:hypothetical protein